MLTFQQMAGVESTIDFPLGSNSSIHCPVRANVELSPRIHMPQGGVLSDLAGTARIYRGEMLRADGVPYVSELRFVPPAPRYIDVPAQSASYVIQVFLAAEAFDLLCVQLSPAKQLRITIFPPIGEAISDISPDDNNLMWRCNSHPAVPVGDALVSIHLGAGGGA